MKKLKIVLLGIIVLGGCLLLTGCNQQINETTSNSDNKTHHYYHTPTVHVYPSSHGIRTMIY